MKKKSNRCLLLLLFFVLIFLCAKQTRFSVSVLFHRADRFMEFWHRLFPPDFSYGSVIVAPLLQTVQMSICGTLFGSAAALIASFWCAKKTDEHWIVRFVCRFFIQIIRCIPVLIMALFFTFIFGIGSFAGTIALFFYTFGIMSRMAYEDIDNADGASFYALKNMGVSPGKAYRKSLFLQILPSFLTNMLYMLEVNVRHAAILGYVGAGGIGLLLNEKISWREYEKVGMILFGIFIAVVLLEGISECLKKWMREGTRKSRWKTWAVGLGVGLLLAACLFEMEAPHITRAGLSVSKKMVVGLCHPDLKLLLNFTDQGVPYLLFETLCIAFLGTVCGALAAAVLSFFCSFRLMPGIVAVIGRLVATVIRTIPFMIYGLVFIRIAGPGAFAGVLTLAFCSVGLLCKRFTEGIDSLDLGGYHALLDIGCGRLTAIRHGILPGVGSVFSSAWLYRFDVNVREASVLGLVGAGGIGAPLIFAMNNYKWQEAGAILAGLVVVVLLIDGISGMIGRHA